MTRIKREPIDPSNTETVRAVLTDARALIADEATWTKGVAARNRDGAPVTSTDPEAVCFCTIGAISRAAYQRGLCDEMHVMVMLDHAAARIHPMPGPVAMPEYLRPAAYTNDYLGREAALAMFDNALENLTHDADA